MARCLAAVAFAVLTLGGCGFHPLYAPVGKTSVGLRSIYVDIIPNRPGQLLRQSLQERLEGTENSNKRYELSVFYIVAGDVIGIQADNSSNRTRFIGSANWTLRMPGIAGTKIISGTARSVDGANVIDAQYFYSDLSTDAINRRMADALADQIVQSLAVYFRAHPDRA
jgi:LPS-assembly lipoprotein